MCQSGPVEFWLVLPPPSLPTTLFCLPLTHLITDLLEDTGEELVHHQLPLGCKDFSDYYLRDLKPP